MKIALDFDNTLCDSIQVWANIYAQVFPERRPLAKVTDVTSWNLAEHWRISEEEKRVIFNIFRRGKMKYASPMDSNFYISIREMQMAGHELYVLTANPEDMRENIEYWLGEWDIKLPIHFVKNVEDKMAFDFDVLVDDAPQVIDLDWSEEERHLIIYTNPWNTEEGCSYNVHRAYNFGDVSSIVEVINYEFER